MARRRRHMAAAVRPGDRVLDLGCGDGAFLGEILALGATPIGVELAEAALARARTRHPGVELHRTPEQGPLPLADGAVDVVWCSETLEHVADTARFLGEARRVLRPAGRLAVTVPFHGRVQGAVAALWSFERAFPPLGDHLRFYTRRSLADALADAGFAAVRVRPAGGPPLFRALLLADARKPA